MGRNETMLLAILALLAAMGASFLTLAVSSAGNGHGNWHNPNFTPLMSLVTAGTGWVVWKVRRSEYDPKALWIAVASCLISAGVLVLVIRINASQAAVLFF